MTNRSVDQPTDADRPLDPIELADLIREMDQTSADAEEAAALEKPDGLDDAVRPDDLEPDQFPGDVDDYTVSMGGRTFAIQEPDIWQLFRLGNIIGAITTRGTKFAGLNMGSIFTSYVSGKAQSAMPIEATISGLLAVIEPRDAFRIFAVLAFGGSKKLEEEGLTWCEGLPEKGSDAFKLSELERAVAYAMAQSEDLTNTVKNFGLVQQAAARWTQLGAKKPRTMR